MSTHETDAEMTTTTDALRDTSFRTVECDIPAELTIGQYRAARVARTRRLSRLPRLLRRRARRRDAGA